MHSIARYSFFSGGGGLVATGLFVELSNGAGAEVAASALVAVSAVAIGAVAVVFCFNMSLTLSLLPAPTRALRMDRNRARPKKMPAQYLVIFVSAVPEPAPNKASVVAPPKAMPAPA